MRRAAQGAPRHWGDDCHTRGRNRRAARARVHVRGGGGRRALALEDGQGHGADLARVEPPRGGDAHAELEGGGALARVVRRALCAAHGGGELGVPPVRGAQDVQEGADVRA